jgi:hypothetical protein
LRDAILTRVFDRYAAEHGLAAGEAEIDAFWRYFAADSMHDFMEPGSEDETGAFAVAPWAEQS